MTSADPAPPLVKASPHDEARKAPLRVALIGGFGIGNFGNDASLEAILGFLRKERPELQLSCICTKPEQTSQAFDIPVSPTVLRPKRLWRWLDLALLRVPSIAANWAYTLGELGRLDLVLFPGTGVFDDFLDTPFGWPSRLFRWCVAARLRGVRVAFVSVGAGPILNPVSRWLMKMAAKQARHRSYRDAKSKAFMQSLGVDERESAVLPDVAFLLPAPPAPPHRAGESLTIGVGVMNYSGWRRDEGIYENYIAQHARFIEILKARGYGMRILVGQTNDWRAVHDIEARLGRSLAAFYPKPMTSIHEVMVAAGEADLVVASRYHVQVAALKMRRPVISLSYAPKNDELLAAVGLAAFTQDVDRVDAERLAGQLDALLDDYDECARVVSARVDAMEARLREALVQLDLAGG